MKRLNHNDAYNHGRLSAKCGLEMSTNPFTTNPEKAEMWARGYSYVESPEDIKDQKETGHYVPDAGECETCGLFDCVCTEYEECEFCGYIDCVCCEIWEQGG